MNRFLVWLGLAEPEPVVEPGVSYSYSGRWSRAPRTPVVFGGSRRREAFDEAVAAFDRPVSTEAVLARYLEQVTS